MKTLTSITCPFCGSHAIMKVEYGIPDEEMIQKIEAGLILHGGCAIEGMMEPFYCLDCDQKFETTQKAK